MIYRLGCAVYPEFRGWLDASVFEPLVSDIPSIVREWAAQGSKMHPGRYDATVFVLTPTVLSVVRRAKVEPLPCLFACASIANAALFVLPISNPANLVVFRGAMPSLARAGCCCSGFRPRFRSR